MKKVALVNLVLLMLVVVCVGTVYAADQGNSKDNNNRRFGAGGNNEDSVLKKFYGGVGGGVMRSNFPRTNNDGSVNGFNSDKDGTVGKVFIGYDFTDNFGVEAGYHYLGKSKFEAVSTGGPSWSAGPVSNEHEAQGESLSGVVRWPLTDRLTLIGTAGLFWWESKETYVDAGVKVEDKDSGMDYTFSGGIEYDVGDKDCFVYRAEVQHYVVDPSSYDITAGTFSIIYKF